MKLSFVFKPQQLAGGLFHSGAILLLAAGAGWGIWQASQAQMGPAFVLAMLPVLAAVLVAPFLVYRAYALRGAAYTLERDGIRLRWGLRLQDIPIDAIRWVRLSGEVAQSLPLPRLHWPGSVLGRRSLPDGGEIEFMASRSDGLVLIATTDTVYAISPQEPGEFIAAYQRLSELGSLAPLPARAVYPSFLLARIWRSSSARLLLLAGAGLNLALLVWVSLVVPGRSQIVMGFISGAEETPAVQLLLLPIISSFFFLADALLGLFFFRRGDAPIEEGAEKNTLARVMAYLLWGSGLLTGILFLVGTSFILLNR